MGVFWWFVGFYVLFCWVCFGWLFGWCLLFFVWVLGGGFVLFRVLCFIVLFCFCGSVVVLLLFWVGLGFRF